MCSRSLQLETALQHNSSMHYDNTLTRYAFGSFITYAQPASNVTTRSTGPANDLVIAAEHVTTLVLKLSTSAHLCYSNTDQRSMHKQQTHQQGIGLWGVDACLTLCNHLPDACLNLALEICKQDPGSRSGGNPMVSMDMIVVTPMGRPEM